MAEGVAARNRKKSVRRNMSRAFGAGYDSAIVYNGCDAV